MLWEAWLTAAFLALGVGLYLRSRRRARALPDVADEAFRAAYAQAYGDGNANLLDDRRRIADLLGMPARKLSVDHEFAKLDAHFDDLAFSVAWGDLEFEMSEEGIGGQGPYRLPPTVGELLADLETTRKRRAAS